jgi:O-antigen ligase
MFVSGVRRISTAFVGGRYSLELVFCLLVFVGIVMFNRDFTHINYRQFYITEFCILLVLLVLAAKLLVTGRLLSGVAVLCDPLLWFVHAIIALGGITLAFSLGHGVLAIKQSVILLYASFVVIFAFSFRDLSLLRRTLGLVTVFLTFYVAIKLGVHLALGITYEHESWRVVHDESDVIFCSLALLGLLIFREEFSVHGKWFYSALLALNIVMLILTMKRTAFLGLFFALVFCFIYMRWLVAFKLKHLYAFLAVLVFSGFVFSLIPQISVPLEQIIRSKMDVLHEGNSAWRILAWQEALAHFYQAPWLGNGYGQRILGASLWAVDTMDPHNSYLAIMVYNGLFGLSLILGIIIFSFVRYSIMLRHTKVVIERKLIAFFVAGLILMMIFPLFNVSLENQRQSIFFWFFIAGAIFLDQRFRARVNKLFANMSYKKLDFVQLGGVVIALVFVSLIGSSSNYVNSYSIYHPDNNGQYPSLQAEDSQRQHLLRSTDGMLLTLDGVNTEHYANLFWILSGTYLDEMKNKSVPYVIEFSLAEPIQNDVVIHLNRRSGGHLALLNQTPGSDRIRVNLERGYNYKELDVYGVTLLVPHHKERRHLLIKQVRLVAAPDL